jgi:hypothetical protein
MLRDGFTLLSVMSVLDLSNFLMLPTPEMLAPPEPPATPAIDTSGTSAGDSSLSSYDSHDLSGYDSHDDEAAAALVNLSGASTVTVDEFESSIPPNLAAASALLDELTTGDNVSVAAMGSLYTLMDSGAALALTSE